MISFRSVSGLLALLLCCGGYAAPSVGAEGVSFPDQNAVLELSGEYLTRDRKLSLSGTVTMRIIVEGGSGLEVQEPPPIKFDERVWHRLEESRGKREPTDGGRQQWEKTLVLEPLIPGALPLPEVILRHRPGPGQEWRTSRWQDIVIEVTGPTDSQARGIRGDTPLELLPPVPGDSSPTPWLPLVLTGLSTVAIVGLAVWTLQRVRRPAPRPAHIRALEALDQLANAPIPADRPGWFHARLSEVVRGYVEERFGLPAPRRTTEEFLESARSQGGFPAKSLEDLATLLHSCDRVKFTGEMPRPGDHEQALALARKIIEESAGARSSGEDRGE